MPHKVWILTCETPEGPNILGVYASPESVPLTEYALELKNGGYYQSPRKGRWDDFYHLAEYEVQHREPNPNREDD